MNKDISKGMVWLLAIACGLIVANLYYAQTLVGPISAATGLSPQAAGLIVTLTQAGYTVGLLFVVPLGDLLENRKLVVGALLFTAAALLAAALSSSAWAFLAAALAIGLGSVAAQVLVPFAAHLSHDATRGQTVGKVVSGLLMGIMLARPVASLVADASSWRVVFGGAAALTVVLAAVLRRRAAYHAGLFGAFSLFWTVTPMMLSTPAFGLSQTGVAVFALVGMAGAIASPIAGKLADSGHTLMATAAALALGVASFLLPLFAPDSPAMRNVALAILAVASIVLDMGVAANLVLGQRAIFSLGAEVRSRLNGLYFALFFAGGALGSAAGGWVYASYGWHAALLAGAAFPGLALLYWTSEYLASRSTERPVHYTM